MTGGDNTTELLLSRPIRLPAAARMEGLNMPELPSATENVLIIYMSSLKAFSHTQGPPPLAWRA